MFCRSCGKEIAENAVACMSCGCDPKIGNKFCQNCGAETNANQIVCIKCGVALKSVSSKPGAKNRTTAGILAILFGGFGVHEFYLGNTLSAVIRLCVTLLTCGWGGLIVGIISFIEGIIYLTQSDEEFQRVYVDGKKAWF